MAEIHTKLSDLMHHDTDREGTTLNQEFFKRFNEHPPQIIINVLDAIGNPVKRMERIYEILDIICNSLELELNEDCDEP